MLKHTIFQIDFLIKNLFLLSIILFVFSCKTSKEVDNNLIEHSEVLQNEINILIKYIDYYKNDFNEYDDFLLISKYRIKKSVYYNIDLRRKFYKEYSIYPFADKGDYFTKIVLKLDAFKIVEDKLVCLYGSMDLDNSNKNLKLIPENYKVKHPLNQHSFKIVFNINKEHLLDIKSVYSNYQDSIKYIDFRKKHLIKLINKKASNK